MINKSITLKATTYKYPTKDERKVINKQIPKIAHFNVKYNPALFDYFFQNKPLDKAHQEEDVFWWANCFNNKLGKLRETYVYLQTHYLRLQNVQDWNTEKHYTNQFLLEYYIEIFYYFYFSVRDVLGQLINVTQNLKCEEDKIRFNQEFIKKIPSEEIKIALTEFIESTKDSYNIRNAFNHRFTPTLIDNRAQQRIKQEGRKTAYFPAKEIKIEQFIKDIDNLMQQLKLLMDKLTPLIK